MGFHEIYFLTLAFIAELLGALSGVSSSTLFVPLAQFTENFQITLTLTAFIHVVGNFVRTLLYRRDVNWNLVLKFGLLSVIFTGAGAQFSSYFSRRIYALSLGLFLILISIYLWRSERQTFSKGKWVPYFGGALSGLLTGMLGSGGAVRSAALMSFQLTPAAFLATSAWIDFGGDVFRLIVYLKKGYLTPEHYFYILPLMVVVMAANLISRRWVKKISQTQFRKIVLIFIFGMGIASVFSGLTIK